MSTRFIFRGIDPEIPTGNAVSVSFDRNSILRAKIENPAGTIETRTIGVGGTEVVTTSKTIGYSDNGKIFVADSTTSIVLSLPVFLPGVSFSLLLKQITAGAGHAFSPVAADFITGNGLTATVNKDVICTGATDRVGDFITITGGSDGWYITSVIGTWAKES